jgi:tetrahydrodipicolinate N-succinyltransferase
VTIRPVRITIDVDEAPASASDAYLRLHLLSHRLAAPRTINMDGTFGALNNVAWTSIGPVAVSEIDDVRMRLRNGGPRDLGARPRQVPAHDRLRHPERACASPTPTACASAPTSPRAPR